MYRVILFSLWLISTCSGDAPPVETGKLMFELLPPVSQLWKEIYPMSAFVLVGAARINTDTVYVGVGPEDVYKPSQGGVVSIYNYLEKWKHYTFRRFNDDEISSRKAVFATRAGLYMLCVKSNWTATSVVSFLKWNYNHWQQVKANYPLILNADGNLVTESRMLFKLSTSEVETAYFGFTFQPKPNVVRFEIHRFKISYDMGTPVLDAKLMLSFTDSEKRLTFFTVKGDNFTLFVADDNTGRRSLSRYDYYKPAEVKPGQNSTLGKSTKLSRIVDGPAVDFQDRFVVLIGGTVYNVDKSENTTETYMMDLDTNQVAVASAKFTIGGFVVAEHQPKPRLFIVNGKDMNQYTYVNINVK